ncbi:MAG TPA: glycine-rich protein, partial [Chitinophagales bacterium]|nr:glycine-rich protein [Chitinophagales bacterium]
MKKNYKGLVYVQVAFLLLFSAWQPAHAQNGVKIAATAGTADPSAMLDITSTNKGLLFPRVTLTGLTDNTTPVNNPATGLVVYNLGSVGVPATGIYFWNGTSWVLLSSGGLSGSGTTNQVTKWTASNAVGNSVITDDGTNVGIGATTPGSKLEINAGANNGLRINNGTVNGILFNTSNTSMSVGTVSNHPLNLYTNNAARVTVDQTGNVQVNTLAGTGYRPVYASANGTLSTTGGATTVFSYTGADQSYTVPAGVTSITVKMWGAGGGGGFFGGWTFGWSGGAGGYTQGTLAVTGGQVLTVIVGGGGVGAFQYNNTTTSSYGGGASACNPGGTDCRYGGQGGGRSAIRNGGTELMTAGGGGGGGASRNASLASYGGAGGGTLGQDGSAEQVHWCKGIGGSQTVGGSGGACNSVGSAGTQFAGGRAGPSNQGYGGGGGGGWYG